MTTESSSSTSGTERSEAGVEQDDCELCGDRGQLKACRDPENNLLDLCPSCRNEWPVEEVAQ